MYFRNSRLVDQNKRINIANSSLSQAVLDQKGPRGFDDPLFLGKGERPYGKENVFVPGLDLDEKNDVVLGGDEVDLTPRIAIIAFDYPEASFFELFCRQILPQLSPSLRLGLRRGLRRRKFCGELASDQVFVML